MGLKLFTVGDSISQGFMSGAAARTDLSYSTVIGRLLNAVDYKHPSWPNDGLPVNIESLLRKLERRLGPNIKGPIEWPIALSVINKYLDDVEDFYERGGGNSGTSFSQSPYHNVAVRGFDLAYSWMVTPSLCKKVLDASADEKDNWWGLVNESLVRTALKVLEAGGQASGYDYSQLDWLKHHHQQDGGVENLVLWLGANNALGTVLNLKVIQTSNSGDAFPDGRPDLVDFDTRREKGWNLWHPEDFRIEYKYMLDKVVSIMEGGPRDYKVFVATVPLVTICPLIKGVGSQQDRQLIKVKEWRVDKTKPAPMSRNDVAVPEDKEYFYAKYYPYFLFSDDFKITLPHLNLSQALHIDNTIREYNRIIQELVADANERLGKRAFYLVDICTALSDMALKRNDYNPPYEFPDYFRFIYPKVDTRYYGTTRDGRIMSGGLFGLDGVHPSAIGQGLIAYEFLKVMKQAGSFHGNPASDIPWAEIFKSDDLYTKPIKITSEIYDNIDLKKMIVGLISNSGAEIST